MSCWKALSANCGVWGERMSTKTLSSELERSPYPENERHVVNGEIVDVTYHEINWWKCFHPNLDEKVFQDAVQGYLWGDYDDRDIPQAIKAVLRMSEEDILSYAEYYELEMSYQRSLWFG